MSIGRERRCNIPKIAMYVHHVAMGNLDPSEKNDSFGSDSRAVRFGSVRFQWPNQTETKFR